MPVDCRDGKIIMFAPKKSQLTIIIIAGVALLSTSLSFQNKASTKVVRTYTICHKTGNPQNPLVEMKVTGEALTNYLDAGDFYGECPADLVK